MHVGHRITLIQVPTINNISNTRLTKHNSQEHSLKVILRVSTIFKKPQPGLADDYIFNFICFTIFKKGNTFTSLKI